MLKSRFGIRAFDILDQNDLSCRVRHANSEKKILIIGIHNTSL